MFSKKSSVNKKVLTIVILSVILISASFLRLYDLTGRNLNYDEGASLSYSHLPVDWIIKINKLYDIHPPLYYSLLHHWVAHFGESDFTLKILSVIFGVIAVFMMYKVGAKLFGTEAGLISAFILAFSEFHVSYSQAVRMYSMMTMLALLSTYFFLKLKDDQSFIKSFINSFFYILFSSLLMYTHIFGIFTILAQNIFVIIFSKNFIKLSRWFMLQITAFLIFLPWIIALIMQILAVRTGKYLLNWGQRPDFIELIKAVKIFFSGYLALAVFSVLIIISVYCCFRAKSEKSANSFSDRDKMYFLLIWFFAYVIIPFIASFVFFSIYTPRYAQVSSLPLILLAAKGLSCIRLKYVKAIAIMIILLLSLSSLKSLYQNNTYPDYYPACPDWKLFAGYIDSNAEDNDLLLIEGPAFTNSLYSHYSERKLALGDAGLNLNNEDMLAKAVNNRSRVWYSTGWLFIWPDEKVKQDLYEKMSKNGFILINEDKNNCLHTFLFEKKNQSLDDSVLSVIS